MSLLHVERELDSVACAGCCARIYAGCHLAACEIEVQEYFGAEKFVNLDLSIDCSFGMLSKEIRLIVYIFRTDAEDNSLAVISFELSSSVCGNAELEAAYFDSLAAIGNLAVHEVHLRRADETGDELICRMIIQHLRGIDLLNDTVLHNDDSCAKSHSLCLVMCNVDDCSAKSVMQLGDLCSHLNTELSIQVGKRLVHKEDLRITNDCTTHSNTLSLTTGKSLRLTIKEFVKVKDLSSFFDLLLDLLLRNLAKREA